MKAAIDNSAIGLLLLGTVNHLSWHLLSRPKPTKQVSSPFRNFFRLLVAKHFSVLNSPLFDSQSFPMKLSRILILALACLLNLAPTQAQTLTPEQQAKLNALPPDLRAQALAELEKFQAANRPASQRLEQPEIVRRRQVDERSEVEDVFEESTDLGATEEKSEERSIDQELKQFGYDLFAGSPTTFAPATDIPVPVNYIVGPGDEIRIQFFGQESASYDLYVSREGVLNIPDLGPMQVTGLSFNELKTEISRRVTDQMIGVQAFVSMGELRSIRIFVLGDAQQPGAYTVSSLSTIIHALYVSGGVRPIGSLRNIQLKRAGETVTVLDLYNLLLRGDTSNDAQLQPGDVIFIPPVGPLVGVSGEVKRPAIYELVGGESIDDAVELAGGYTAKAYPALSQVERIAPTGGKEILDIDLTAATAETTRVRNGDTIRVYSTLDRFDNFVRLEGAVERPGDYQWLNGMRVSDIIPSRELLLSDADLNYSLVVSKSAITGKISTRSFSLEALLQGRGENLRLQKEDRILIFKDIGAMLNEEEETEEFTTKRGLSNDEDSDDVADQLAIRETPERVQAAEAAREGLREVIDALRIQGTSADPQRIVEISGRVRYPGDYPLDDNMRVSDLIRAAGGFTEDAYTLEAELLRFVDNGKTERESLLLPVDLSSMESSKALDLELTSFDQLLVKRIPEWAEREEIVIEGEVRFPGTYVIERGESVARIIERAGGLTELAYPQAAVFLRESLRQAEAEQIKKLRERLKEDISAARLQADKFDSATVETAEGLLTQLEGTEAVGRLVIDLPKILEDDPSLPDLRALGGDKLVIPQKPQSVTVIGSVNYPTSHIHQPTLQRDAYIASSGGFLKNADKKRTYVVRANGQVVTDSRSRFFPRSGLEIYPGDTIVVPLDVDRMRPLRYWAEISQIVYQIALGVAAVNSL